MTYRNKKHTPDVQQGNSEDYNSHIALDKSAYSFDQNYLQLIFSAITSYRSAIANATEPNDFKITATFRILLAISGSHNNEQFLKHYEDEYDRLKKEKKQVLGGKSLTEDEELNLLRLAETATLARIMDYFVSEHDLIQLHVIGVM